MPNQQGFSADVMDGSPRAVIQKAQVVSNIRTTCFSVEELKQIVLTCNCDIIDLSYTVKAPDGTVTVEGAITSAPGTREYTLSKILPLEEMRRFEKSLGRKPCRRLLRH